MEKDVLSTLNPAFIVPLVADSRAWVRLTVASWMIRERPKLVGRGRSGPSTGHPVQEDKGMRKECEGVPKRKMPARPVASV